MVGHHQAVRRHERCRAAAEAHDGAHGIRGEVGQRGRIELEAVLLEGTGDLRQLGGLPHAFDGVGGGDERGGEGRGEGETAHDVGFLRNDVVA
jgi:hypothetical protein